MAEEYIAKSQFAKALDEAVRKYPTTFYNGLSIAAALLQKQPAADVRPVVRCRECKLHDSCYTEDVFKFARLNDDKRFCGIGKRKGGDE